MFRSPDRVMETCHSCRTALSRLDSSCSFVMEKADQTHASLDQSNLMEQSVMSDICVPSQTRRLKEVTARHILESFKKLTHSRNSASSSRESV